MKATKRYGSQFSSSRVYASIYPYQELEELLDEIFQAHSIVTPSTTLGHCSAIPVLVSDKDRRHFRSPSS